MLIGYARVSREKDQDTALQLRTLQEAGAERVFTEHASGGRWDRPELHRMLDQLRPGDVLVVWKLDRLSRSLKDLLHLMELVEGKGAGFRSLTEAIDTTTAAGRMMMQMVGAFAEFERAMIRERTKAGLDQARQEGRIAHPSTTRGDLRGGLFRAQNGCAVRPALQSPPQHHYPAPPARLQPKGLEC